MTTKKATPGAATSAPSTVPDAASSGDPEVIRADIAQTRAELGDSVEALADKADVKARAKRGVKTAKDRATQKVAAAKDRTKETAEVATERAKETAEQVGETVRRRPATVAAALAGVAAAIGSVVFIKRRRAAKARTAVRRWRSR
jgi:ElaB/YqjD/DUF883 family membrane-anchored ribosome-binding protein